ncbi:MAG: RcnB family protein [Steroidobacteraceae bacterium]
MKLTVIAAMVVSLLAGSAALADPPQQSYEHDHGRQERHRDQHPDQRQDRHQEERHERGEHRAPPPRAHVYFNSGRYRRPHGYHAHRWRRGDRLPPVYRSPAYIIPDPVRYRLRGPPPGYYWVRVNNNAVLAAIGTGVVVDVVVNLFR